MPHLTGVFEEFPDLDRISSNDLKVWIREKIEEHSLVNLLGNRILYPQTVASSRMELEVDFAILREGLKQRPTLVYEPQTSKIFIPETFIQRFPTLQRLAGIIIEAISPKGVIQIYIKGESSVKLVGTLISPPDDKKLDAKESKVKVVVDGVEGFLNLNSLSISSVISPLIKIKLGVVDYSVSGGELGVIIDLRVMRK